MPSELCSADVSSSYIASEKGEAFHRYYGFATYYGGTKLDVGLDSLWLPSETGVVYSLLRRGDDPTSVFIQGSAGSGKSALLYGLKTFLRRDGVPYHYIDGHYEKTPAHIIEFIINRASQMGFVILYDSADHLLGRTRKIRGLPREVHLARSRAILASLVNAIDLGTSVVVTSHEDQWISDLGETELKSNWTDMKERMKCHPVRGIFHDTIELSLFYQKSGISEAASNYLANLHSNRNFINHLLSLKGDKKYLAWFNELFFKYSMAKIIAADKFKENIPLLKLLYRFLETGDTISEKQFWNSYIDFIFSKYYRLLFHSKVV